MPIKSPIKLSKTNQKNRQKKMTENLETDKSMDKNVLCDKRCIFLSQWRKDRLDNAVRTTS